MSSPVIVTGGAGFIGSHLVSALLHTQSEIIVIDRLDRPKSLPSSRQIAYHKIDAYKINEIDERPPHTAAIIHLAAETSVEKSVQQPLSTVRANIGVTCAALEFGRRLDCERFVLASTAAVYGDRARPCRETDIPAPESPYAVSKLASEQYCKLYSTLYGLPTVILRYFNVYGPGQSSHYSGAITRFVKRVIQGKPPVIFGDGEQTRDFIFVDDVIEATMFSLQKPLAGGTVINVGRGKEISINSLAERILRILDEKKLRPIHISSRLGDIRHSVADISLARRKIGFRPSRDLDEGLGATIEWLRRAN